MRLPHWKVAHRLRRRVQLSGLVSRELLVDVVRRKLCEPVSRVVTS